ncbi:MAG: decaprenyl-phosphate phosphoribosyltransferase [Chloroflexi bacterium]|nr:decaprenyl-phosphate phosphoribosyltransferase [Chloroflexota bacterium]
MVRRESRAVGLLRVLRPKQWAKNLLLFLPFVFTLNLPGEGWDFSHPQRALALASQATLGFLLYCLLAGATYIINDLLDLERDRAHPVKRSRPLAAGVVSPSLAMPVAGTLLLGGVAGSFLLSPPMGLVSLGYVALTVGYSVILKHLVILDVLAVAGGYVIRVLAGAVVIDVPISPWLYLCTILGALFISAAKRRNEIQILAEDGAAHRRTLAEYTPGLLDQMTAVVTASTLMAYALYTFTAPNLPDQMMLTIPFVIYGLFRYLYLVHSQNLGGSPEEVLLTDRPLLLTVLLWVATALAILWIFPRP